MPDPFLVLAIGICIGMALGFAYAHRPEDEDDAPNVKRKVERAVSMEKAPYVRHLTDAVRLPDDVTAWYDGLWTEIGNHLEDEGVVEDGDRLTAVRVRCVAKGGVEVETVERPGAREPAEPVDFDIEWVSQGGDTVELNEMGDEDAS